MTKNMDEILVFPYIKFNSYRESGESLEEACFYYFSGTSSWERSYTSDEGSNTLSYNKVA